MAGQAGRDRQGCNDLDPGAGVLDHHPHSTARTDTDTRQKH